MSEPVAPADKRRRDPLLASLAIAGLVLAIDQATKHWAVNRLSAGRTIDVIWTLRFNLTFNSGMAFSQGTGFGPVIGVLALVVVVGLLVSMRRTGSKLSTVAVGLVIGGALGNVADRLLRGDAWLRGSVVDFIDFRWFPIFNVADMAVDIGGALLVLGSLLAGRHVSRTVSTRSTDSVHTEPDDHPIIDRNAETSGSSPSSEPDPRSTPAGGAAGTDPQR